MLTSGYHSRFHFPHRRMQVEFTVEVPHEGRTIVQGEPLMFRNVEEAKDAVDLILDRLSEEAARPESP